MNNLLILICFAISLSSHVKPDRSNNDHNSLVFKNCADSQTSQSYSETLSTLFQELVSQSSKSKYFRTSEADGETAVSGLFQCREDISVEECRNCVRDLPGLSRSLCGGSESARVQLRGCYVRYEPERLFEEYPDRGGLIHKICGETSHDEAVGGFEEMRESAFSALEDEIAERGGGFCKTAYESVAVTAQCEGGVGGCECGECVNNAARIAGEECGVAFSGEVYLDKCFVSYSYFPQGIPTNFYPGEREEEERGNNGVNGKLVAIVLGGAAAACFGLVFLMFFKSWTKKEDDF